MTEQVSALFVRLCELAKAEGDVPEDGSGIDGTWSTTVPARKRERDWTIAMNADTDQKRTVQNVPTEGQAHRVRPAGSFIWLGETPVGTFGPYGGELAVEMGEGGPQSIEDELIEDVETRVEEVAADG